MFIVFIIIKHQNALRMFVLNFFFLITLSITFTLTHLLNKLIFIKKKKTSVGLQFIKDRGLFIAHNFASMTKDTGVLYRYSISGQVISLAQNSQCLVTEHAWYTFHRLRKNENLSELWPSPEMNIGPVVW